MLSAATDVPTVVSETVADIVTTGNQGNSAVTLPQPLNSTEKSTVVHRQNQTAIDGNTDLNDDTEDENSYPKGARLYFTFVSLIIVLVALGLDISIVAVAIPALSDEWHSIPEIAWYSTALRLVMCSFMFAFGKAYTLFSVKYLFLLSLATFEIGNVLCTFSQSSVMFIVGRAICGFGTAGLSGGVFTILTHTFPLRQRALVGGVGALFETVAAVMAPLIGGALITHWTWRACFGINIPLGIIGCLAIFFFLHLDPNPNESLSLTEKLKQLDILGTCIFAPAMVCLLLALQWGGAVYHWDDARIIVLFALSGLLFATFGVIEWRSGERAAVPFRILKNRSLLAGAFFSMCCNGTTAVVEYYISIYFQGIRGETAFKTGVYLIPIAIGLSVGAPLAGGFTTWVGYYYPTMYVATVLLSVSTGVLTTLDSNTKLAEILCMLAILGFGLGFGIQAPQVAAQTTLKVSEVSIGIAIVQFGSQMGPVLYLAAGGALFTNRLNAEIRQYSPSTNTTLIDNLGLTDIRNTFSGETLNGVLTGYNRAVIETLYLPVALSCASIVGTVFMERISVKKESERRKAKAVEKQDDESDHVDQCRDQDEKRSETVHGDASESRIKQEELNSSNTY